MTLTLRAVSLNDLPLTQPITAHFDRHGGTIGRSDANTMALPDPERHISRQQAQISAAGSGYMIKNVGTANPIVVRNQPLASGECVALAHSDQVRIGGYLLEVVDDDAGDARTRRPGVARAQGGVDAGRPLSLGNPFADLIDADGASASSRLSLTGSSARLPDDFDPFAPPAPRAGPPCATSDAAAPPGGVFDDLIPNPVGASIDELFQLQECTGADPLADFLSDIAAPSDKSVPLSTDPLALFDAGHAARRTGPVAELPPDRVPEIDAAFAPPVPQLPADVAPPAAALSDPIIEGPAPESMQGSEEARDLWSAFCQGAGIRLDPPQGLNPELMRVMGQLLRAAVDGTLQLIAVRSATRHELHAEVTVIRPRNNNPLKFSPDGRSAIEQLLQPPLRGFLPGPSAMGDAMSDLVGHAIGTMAGTRAALEGVLGRFAPRELEAKLSASSVIDSLLPMNRRSKLWELYLQHYDAIRDEAQDDFHRLFGRAFLAAYEQQLERLRRERPAG